MRTSCPSVKYSPSHLQYLTEMSSYDRVELCRSPLTLFNAYYILISPFLLSFCHSFFFLSYSFRNFIHLFLPYNVIFSPLFSLLHFFSFLTFFHSFIHSIYISLFLLFPLFLFPPPLPSRRGCFSRLPVLYSNDLVHGSW